MNRLLFQTTLKLTPALLLIALSASLTACAVGNKYDLASSPPKISEKVATSVAVGVHDQRSYILNEDKEPKFIGLQRGGFNNPFDVTTQSGKPFSWDVENSVITGLKNAGVDTSRIVLSHTLTPGKAKQTLLATGADHSLLVVINKWKTDTFTTTNLIYDLGAYVYDKKSQLVAENRISGANNLGGDVWNPNAFASSAVPNALSDKLDELLDTPEIISALKK